MNFTRLALCAATVAGISLATAPAALAVTSPQWVVAADITNGTRAAAGQTSWFADISNAGTYATTSNAFDASESLEMDTPASNDGVRILNSYGAGVTPPTIPQIMNGGSYTYSGSNVNFQIEMFYTPTDPTYGPDPANGANKCTAAGAAFPGMCYTVIKWEPLTTSPSTWTTVDLSADTALGTSNGGWKNTNRIGIYAKPGPLIGNTMTEYLGQMSNYQVLAVGASVGTGTAESVGFLQTMTYDGVTHHFRAEPPAPTTTSSTAPTSVSTSASTSASSAASSETVSTRTSSVPSSSTASVTTATITSVKDTNHSVTTTPATRTTFATSTSVSEPSTTTYRTPATTTALTTTALATTVLAATGTTSSTVPMAVLGTLLTMAGGALTLAARRRRTHRSH